MTSKTESPENQGTKKFNFTVRRLEALKPREKRYDVRDAGKQYLRLTVFPSGKKSYYYVKWILGRTERVKIGSFPGVSVKAARDKVKEYEGRGVKEEGFSPSEEKRRFREDDCLGDLWDEYIAEVGGFRREYSLENDKKQFQKHLKDWKKKRLTDITRERVARRHALIAAKKKPDGGPVAANRVLAILSSMWGWAQASRSLEIENPCKGVKRRKEKRRKRYLLPDELRRFFLALNSREGSDGRDALLCLLFTGQRKGTICGLRWSEVDFRDRVLTVPAERMKSDVEHTVPLVDPALGILKARRAAADRKAEYVFPSHSGRGHLYDLRNILGRVLEAAEISNAVTVHDLRRTFATYCGEMLRDPGPILGHAPVGVTDERYKLATLPAMREAMTVTVAKMLNIATAKPEEKVVEFPGAGA